MKKTLKPGDLIVVLWEDAAHLRDTVPGTYLCATVGWLVRITDNEVHVATEWFEDGQGRDFNTVPRGMVKRIFDGRRLDGVGRRLQAEEYDFSEIDPKFERDE